MRYWKTVVTVTVVSEGAEPPEFGSIEALAYAITDGPSVGQSEDVTEEITAPQAAALLTDLGSEPGFFSLDANGNRTED